MSGPRVAVGLLGARMHYAVPHLLHRGGMLAGFFTDSYIGNKPVLRRALSMLPAKLKRGAVARFAGRGCPELPTDLVESDEFLGLWYWNALRKARSVRATEMVQAKAARWLARNIERKDFAKADTVWGFNTASVELFRAAKARGLRCILEQTYLPYALEAQLLGRELAEWPDWQPDLELPETDRQHVAREATEWELADIVVGGSAFVGDGLSFCGVPTDKIRVIPYGVDPARFYFTHNQMSAKGNRPLRVLFVGEVSLRKGAHYLLMALAKLGPSVVEARFAGRLSLNKALLGAFTETTSFLGPVPRLEMPGLYRWADVFVLPSIIEGSATVVYEALMSGLPVIVTPNVGSIVTDGREGRIVPIRDVDAISTALHAYAEDEALRVAHAEGALAASGRAGIERYGADLLAMLRRATNA